MKRKFEVARLDCLRDGLAVTVIVHEVGPTWKMCLRIPWQMLLAPDVTRAIAGAQQALIAATMTAVEVGLWE